MLKWQLSSLIQGHMTQIQSRQLALKHIEPAAGGSKWHSP